MVLEACGEVGGHALHALGADRLDARLLDRLEHGAGLAASRRERADAACVVAGDGSAAASAWPRITAISVLDGTREGSGRRAVLPDNPGGSLENTTSTALSPAMARVVMRQRRA